MDLFIGDQISVYITSDRVLFRLVLIKLDSLF